LNCSELSLAAVDLRGHRPFFGLEYFPEDHFVLFGIRSVEDPPLNP
jgi:hypothetical protein